MGGGNITYKVLLLYSSSSMHPLKKEQHLNEHVDMKANPLALSWMVLCTVLHSKLLVLIIHCQKTDS
jgi:hypothetical protein